MSRVIRYCWIALEYLGSDGKGIPTKPHGGKNVGIFVGMCGDKKQENQVGA
jgi:hypothetical protein